MDSYLTLSRISEGSPVLQFSIFASLAFKLPSVIFFFAAAGSSYSLNANFFLLLTAANSSSFSFHLSPCFATSIQVWLFFRSLPFVACVSSGLKKSFTSSSHLFLSLPTALHVLIFVLNPGFHPAAFLTHRSSGGDAILIANRHFILLCISIEHGILAPLIQSLCLSLLQKRSRYLGRNRCQCCFLLVFRFRSSLGFLFFLKCRFSDFHVACHLFLYFLLVCTMGRSIFRFVYSINLSSSFVKVHVPHA